MTLRLSHLTVEVHRRTQVMRVVQSLVAMIWLMDRPRKKRKEARSCSPMYPVYDVQLFAARVYDCASVREGVFFSPIGIASIQNGLCVELNRRSQDD